jgi:hypothetical protein
VFDRILHGLDLFLSLLHLFVNSSLQILDLVQIVLNLFLLDSQSSSCVLSVFKLALLEFQIITHILNLLLGGQLVLSSHGLLHML